MRILLVIVGIFGAFSLASWAAIFYLIIRDGQVILVEPVNWIIKSEFALAVFMCLVSLTAVLIAIRSKNENKG